MYPYDELTPEILNAFVDKIIIQKRMKQDGKRMQALDVYYSYVGFVNISTDEEMQGNATGIYAAYQFANSLNTGKGRRKTALLPIQINFYPYLV